MADEQEEAKPAKPVLREVWFSCRGTPGCEGKKAAIVWSKGTPGKLSTTRYKCLTCGKAWHVQI